MSEQKMVRYVWAAPMADDAFMMHSEVIDRIRRGDGISDEERARAFRHTDDQALFRVTVEEIEPPKPQVSDDYVQALRDMRETTRDSRDGSMCMCPTCYSIRHRIDRYAEEIGVTLQEGGAS